MRLPDSPFYLFGMGGRRKLFYRKGGLADALTGEPIRSWRTASDRILASQYRVELETADEQSVAIWEDEEGLWLEERGDRTCLSPGKVALPSFKEHRHKGLLRILHQEILVNMVNGRPFPNFLVYKKPWYRDGAMICMCLEKTGNLGLVEEWIQGLREPYDRNNSGDCEPDNLGQALYLVSLVSDASHPLVETVLRALPEVTRDKHLVGPTDQDEHPVYQTKWLKFALKRLALEDRYEIPPVFDRYSALFWMDYREAHVEGPRFPEEWEDSFPYLGWAEAHFYREPAPLALAGTSYPLTWEVDAWEAKFEEIRLVSQEHAERKIAAPHTWHAAEMFLYLLELG